MKLSPKRWASQIFYNDQREATAVSREHQHLSKLRDSYKNLEHTIEQIEENRKIIDENADPELVELAKEDIDALTASIEPLKKRDFKNDDTAGPDGFAQYGGGNKGGNRRR